MTRPTMNNQYWTQSVRPVLSVCALVIIPIVSVGGVLIEFLPSKTPDVQLVKPNHDKPFFVLPAIIR